jgi:hypothetical protein
MLKTVSSITNAIGAVNYAGTWNASTNTPTLTSSVGTKGSYYSVSVAGSTNINGINIWGVGDWIVFNGSTWERVDGGTTGNFSTITATGAATLAIARSKSGVTASLAQNASEAIFDDGGNGGVYLVVCKQADGGYVWRASAEIFFNGIAGATYSKVSSNVTIGSSGNNITVTNNNASAMDFAYAVLRLL